ncbi:MAG: phosphate ABC transporter permease subunit PstC [Candidatus Bathycorpusculaceae bacterium]
MPVFISNLGVNFRPIFIKSITGDAIFKIVSGLFASSIFLLIGLMFYELVRGSWLSIQTFGLRFLVSIEWDPAVSRVFGALPLILGTLVTSAIALLVGVPVSLGIGLALSEYMPKKLEFALSFLVELLAAVPSVVYGLWGIFVLIPFLREYLYPYLQALFGFVPLFSGSIYGGGVLTGGTILAIMIIPTVSTVLRDLFSQVPNSQREAMIALGATKWETTKAVISYARSGVFGAVILGLGRAIGETMAITMVVGNKFQVFPSSLFDAWYTMAAIIANELLEATYDLYVSALINVALVLFFVTFMVNILARLVVWRALKMVKGIAME